MFLDDCLQLMVMMGVRSEKRKRLDWQYPTNDTKKQSRAEPLRCITASERLREFAWEASKA